MRKVYYIPVVYDDNYDKKADTWIFPILFHVTHGIEVYLKGFNSQYQILAKLKKQEYQDTKIEGGHDIRQLCQVTMSLLRANNDSRLLKEFAFVEQFIEILYENTNDMTFARYPLTDKKVDQFYVGKNENIVIDLNVLKAWVTRIFLILNNNTGFVDCQIDEIKEGRYEMKREYEEVMGWE